MSENIIEIDRISVEYQMKMFHLRAVDNVSLNIKRNTITALVGESGSGKTTLASTILNCLVDPGVVTSGTVSFVERDGTKREITNMKDEELRLFRWSKVSMVFQGAQSSLNPVMTVFQHFKETLEVHIPHISKAEVMERSLRVLKIVNLDANQVLKMYPHELSGGMKQRVMIAFSLILDPEFIVLDEPTTALDVITQDYVFSILKKINREMGISMLLLTHDMGIVAKYADYLGVMYAGQLVEYGDTTDVFKNRFHPYTRQLIQATPSLIKSVSEIHSIDGSPPNMLCLPEGCPFAPRCLQSIEECKKDLPRDWTIFKDHTVKCHLYKEEGN